MEERGEGERGGKRTASYDEGDPEWHVEQL
jgi:hypothetical protein